MNPAEPHPSEQSPGEPVGEVAVVTVVRANRERLEGLHRALGEGRRTPSLVVVVALDQDRLVDWKPEDGVPVKVVPLSAQPEGLPWVEAANVGASVALEADAEVVVFVDAGGDDDPDVGPDLVGDLERAARSEGIWWGEEGSVTSFAVTRDAWACLGGLPEEDVSTVFDADFLSRAAQGAGLRAGDPAVTTPS